MKAAEAVSLLFFLFFFFSSAGVDEGKFKKNVS